MRKNLILTLSLILVSPLAASAGEGAMPGDCGYMGLGYQEVKPLSSDFSNPTLSDINVAALVNTRDASRKISLLGVPNTEKKPANWRVGEKLPGADIRPSNMPVESQAAHFLSGAPAPLAPDMTDLSDPRAAKFNADLRALAGGSGAAVVGDALAEKKDQELAPVVRYSALQ